MIFIPLGLGALCPMAHGLNFLIRWMLIAMLFMVFLRLRIDDLRPRRSHFRLLAANAAIGCVAYGVLWLFGADAVLARSAFFTGITPTATAAAVIVGLLGGRVDYAVSAFLATNFGMALLFPFLIPVVIGNPAPGVFLHVVKSLLVVIGIPLAAAIPVRLFYDKAAELPKRCKDVSFFLWVGAIFLVIANASAFLRAQEQLSVRTVLGIAAVSLGLCVFNFWFGRFLGGKKFRREASQALGQKNTTLTIYLALTFANPLVALGPTFYVLWHNAWNAGQLHRYGQRRHLREVKLKTANERKSHP